MRIIAGEHRGRRLLAPVGDQTRPVTDRAKQSIFDIVAPRLPDAIVYDCFAGTGSFGLESLSRGARRALFFESHRPTANLLKQNIDALRVADRAQIVSQDWFLWIASQSPSERADVIFLDPPYRYLRERADDLQSAAERLARSHLAADGLLVFRHDAADALPLRGFTRVDERSYGGMAAEFLAPTPAA